MNRTEESDIQTLVVPMDDDPPKRPTRAELQLQPMDDPPEPLRFRVAERPAKRGSLVMDLLMLGSAMAVGWIFNEEIVDLIMTAAEVLK